MKSKILKMSGTSYEEVFETELEKLIDLTLDDVQLGRISRNTVIL